MSEWQAGFNAGYEAGLTAGLRGSDYGAAKGIPSAPGRARTPKQLKKTRAPSAYNRFMKKELKKLRKKHPRTKQTVLFKRAAKSWRRKK